MIRTRLGLSVVMLAAAGGCEPVPYTVDWSELVLLPRETAIEYLQALPGSTEALSLRPGMEHCEFEPNGMRVAAASPQHARKLVDDLRADLRRTSAAKARAEHEQRRIEAAQGDRTGWMRARGYGSLADEQARLDADQRDTAQWLRARGLSADEAEQAPAGMARERADLADRMRPVEEAMADERRAAVERWRELDMRERQLQTRVDDVLKRVHEVVPYERVAFVVFRRLRGPMEVDVKYAVGEAPRIEGCGFELDPDNPETPGTLRRMATALSALGAEGQAGVTAEPRIGAGRRYSARPDPRRQLTDAPPDSGRPESTPAN